MVFQNDLLELLAIIFMAGVGAYLLYCSVAIAILPLAIVAFPLVIVVFIVSWALKIIMYAVVFATCVISDLSSKISRQRQKM